MNFITRNHCLQGEEKDYVKYNVVGGSLKVLKETV